MHTVIEISNASETVFYICFPTNNRVKNKQPPDCDCLYIHFHFTSLPQLFMKSFFIKKIKLGDNKISGLF